VPGTIIDQIKTLNIPVSDTQTILVKTQTSGTGHIEDIQVTVVYETGLVFFIFYYIFYNKKIS
jgi:hypothetical protein